MSHLRPTTSSSDEEISYTHFTITSHIRNFLQKLSSPLHLVNCCLKIVPNFVKPLFLHQTNTQSVEQYHKLNDTCNNRMMNDNKSSTKLQEVEAAHQSLTSPDFAASHDLLVAAGRPSTAGHKSLQCHHMRRLELDQWTTYQWSQPLHWWREWIPWSAYQWNPCGPSSNTGCGARLAEGSGDWSMTGGGECARWRGCSVVAMVAEI
jgi:hypothetical protein